ncbi:hypothetical protein LK09_17770 [Microbacterium mangrovi]|uniref:Uncharacterized protein n=1 Tax=Microbacterium mangrovi TaxID=1348253 RepID=A0A0B2A2N9_9MICO|nr:hypothetical protein [Microbacterium mangrovi]KHK95867.1 hypothetical protein LK09_17770 [Microbacterium mangrovi]
MVDPHGGPRDEDERIPFEPSSTREPYLDIVAPRLDRVSPRIFKPRTYEGRRAIRGLGVLLAVIAVAAVIIIVVGLTIQLLA